MLMSLAVTVRTNDGSMHTRRYVPGSAVDMSQQEYGEWALGNLIALVMSSTIDTLDFDNVYAGTSFGDVNLTNKAGAHDFGVAGPAPYYVTGWAVEVIRGE